MPSADMDSFKLVLPSNVSHEHFPNNTSSHYQTYLHNPIQLEGKWEVAAESIYYSANIENEHERATFNFEMKHEVKKYINDDYTWSFTVSPEKTWIGFEGVKVPISIFPFDIYRKLNACNIYTSKDKTPLFEFTPTSQGALTYRCLSPNFSFEVHPSVAAALGFGKYNCTFTGTGPHTGRPIRNTPIPYDEHIQYVYFFHNQLVQREQRLTLKYPGEDCDANTLLKFWYERIKSVISTDIEFSKGGQVIIHHHYPNKALVFSPELAKSISHLAPILHRQTRWGWDSYRPSKTVKKEFWYVDVYGTNLQTTVTTTTQFATFEYYPRLFLTVERMITFVNEGVLSLLKAKLNDQYDVEKHTFTLTASRERVTLNLGTWLYLSCSPNVSQMMGFTVRDFNGGNSYVSTSSPYTVSQRVQRVLLMTNVIESVSYGSQRLRVLQDFVHRIKGPNIVEKRFHPLSFLPVVRNYIDTITIQLVNEDQEQITAKDVKTVVILHFQRIK